MPGRDVEIRGGDRNGRRLGMPSYLFPWIDPADADRDGFLQRARSYLQMCCCCRMECRRWGLRDGFWFISFVGFLMDVVIDGVGLVVHGYCRDAGMCPLLNC